MRKNKLSPIENNLAVIVALTQAQVDTMEVLADKCEKLMEVSEDFEVAYDVWKQAAIDTENAVELQMAGLAIYDTTGKVKAFLESHRLEVKWVKKE
jgi:hypothetical protein